MAIEGGDVTLSMSEGEMTVGSFTTKGFRLYSLILLALMGFLTAAIFNSPALAQIQTVVVFLLGVFTGKKA
jgi:hypothetical protein